MVTVDTEIANLALTHLGITKRIGNIETERSNEARTINVLLPTMREKALRDFPWQFATAIEDLVLIEEDPNDEWDYSYVYPVNCLMFRRILSGLRTDTRDSRVSYRVIRSSTGKIILTDQEDAECEYTYNETSPAKFTPDFALAVSLLVAGFAAPALTAGDPYKLGIASLQKYAIEFGNAKSNNSNEQQPDEEPESEFIRGRS